MAQERWAELPSTLLSLYNLHPRCDIATEEVKECGLLLSPLIIHLGHLP